MKKPLFTSIGGKLIAVHLIMIATIIMVGLISFNHLNSIETILSEEVIKKADARYVCKNIILQSKYIYTNLDEYIRHDDPNKKRATHIIIDDTVRLIKEYRSQLGNMNLLPGEKELLAEVDAVFKNYYRSLELVIDRFSGFSLKTGSGGPSVEEFKDRHALLTTQLLKLEMLETDLMHESQDNAKSQIEFFKIQILIFCVIFAAFSIIVSMIRIRSVTRPINRLVTVLERYGKGDTGVRAPIDTWDEIGFFASRFNQMLEQIDKKNIELGNSNKALVEKNIQLKRNEKRYRLLAENASDIIWTADMELKLTYISPSFEKISGYAPEELYERGLEKILTGESFREAASFHKSIIEKEKTGLNGPEIKISIIVDMVSKAGTIKPIETSFTIIRDSEGRAVEILGVSRDITERKNAEEKIIQQYSEIQRQYRDLEAINLEINRAHEEALRASENYLREKERLSTTLRSITDGVITTNLHGKIELMNRAAEIITGWTQNEAVGKGIDQALNIINDRDRALMENPVHEIIAGGAMFKFENNIVLIDRSNNKKNIEAAGAPIEDRDGNSYGTVFVIRDTTDRLKMESELFKAKKIESLGVFAGGIAHDFNNLLTAIIGNISLARMSLTGSGPLSDILGEAEKVSLRARELTTQLLTFSRGGAPIKKLTPLQSLLSDTANFVLSGSNVKPELFIGKNLWNAEIDGVQISQVIHNLILNARQAMPEGGTISICAENIRLDQTHAVPLPDGNYIKITISDQGIGIPAEHIQNIFDPYFTTKSMGSGLGLTITYSIIKKHDGHILVDSIPGRGTVFTVFLPASEKEYTGLPDDAAAVTIKGGRLLLMDDEDIVLDVTEKMLLKLGFEVVRAKNGEDAVAIYRSAFENGTPFDIVIMDLTIPGGMGGKKALDAIKAFDPGVRAIVSSGYSNDPVMANYRDYGFSGVVTKPFRFSELAAVLGKISNERPHTS